MVVPVLVPPKFDLSNNKVVSTVLAPPTISALKAGFVTPTPKLPALSNLATSAPPSANAIVSAAGKKIPVLVSPVVVMAWADTVPACTVVTPVADNVENAPVDAVVAPMVVPLIEPPVMAILAGLIDAAEVAAAEAEFAALVAEVAAALAEPAAAVAEAAAASASA
jgi:hypothetical protein